MIEMLQQASSYAADVDGLIILVAVLSGFWFFVAQAVFFWLIFRYRAKPGKKSKYVTGREKHLNRWISFPHGLVLVCDILIIMGCVNVWYNVKQRLPEADRVVRITGQQWAWTFQHPGSDGELDTEDDIYAVDELHVEVDKTYHFHPEARDVLHSFSVPVFRPKQDALPGWRSTPRRASYTDPAFWETRDDERIKTVIRDGGAAVGASPLMAPWGVLFDDAQLDALVEYVKSFRPVGQ